MPDKGQTPQSKMSKSLEVGGRNSDFVLDKVIFSNVFEKDIRRIYIYRKSERLAKALQLITPAFTAATSLRNRIDAIGIGLIDAAILPPLLARDALSRELLALSSILSVARAGNLLSDMNADLITREAHLLLQEIAGYEEPRIFLEESPTLADLAKRAPDTSEATQISLPISSPKASVISISHKGQSKGHISDISSRQESILTILQNKGPSYIKDISTLIREVSEKTIQRELLALVDAGKVQKEGERRWTRYFI